MCLLHKFVSQHLKWIINKEVATKLSSSAFLRIMLQAQCWESDFHFYDEHEQQNIPELH